MVIYFVLLEANRTNVILTAIRHEQTTDYFLVVLGSTTICRYFNHPINGLVFLADFGGLSA